MKTWLSVNLCSIRFQKRPEDELWYNEFQSELIINPEDEYWYEDEF